MKIAFFGTGEFSKNILQGILNTKKIDITLVVSQPDKPVGRKKIITPTPVKICAEENNIPVLQPERLKDNIDFFTELKKGEFDFIVVVAYGKIVPIEVLQSPKYACVNIHGSILPLYRGASPIQEAIKNGDSKTGLTIMYMSEGMDEGDILSIQEVEINPSNTTQDMFNAFEKIGPELLINTLEKTLSGEITGQKQIESSATYCSKIDKQDGHVSFQNQTGSDIYNTFRAYKTWPGIFTYYNEKKLSIEECSFEKKSPSEYKIGSIISTPEKEIAIVCQDGFLILRQIKLEGKKSMDINSFINGNKNFLHYNLS
ncbi:MAG: methionyl-tRNA formyltransferase [Candidatus Gracilibacteria bacterium]|nr:methionyl-tRNA formyltransferase [Candidatus Gracilibacteria bacterium]